MPPTKNLQRWFKGSSRDEGTAVVSHEGNCSKAHKRVGQENLVVFAWLSPRLIGGRALIAASVWMCGLVWVAVCGTRSRVGRGPFVRG